MRTSLILLIAVAAICLVATPTAAGRLGGWFPLPDINDPHVQELGGWAVAEHNRIDKAALVFKRVVSGQYQIVAGIKYNLIIEASNPDGKYAASLMEQDWTNSRVLFSFNPAG